MDIWWAKTASVLKVPDFSFAFAAHYGGVAILWYTAAQLIGPIWNEIDRDGGH